MAVRSCRTVLFATCVVCLALAIAVSASMSEQLLKVPLMEVGSLWVKATQDLIDKIQSTVMSLLTVDLESPWTYVKATLLTVFIYYFYVIFFANMNRVRLLGSIGYTPDPSTGMTQKEMANWVRKRREAGDMPPVYPNGWFTVMESNQLVTGEVKMATYLGLTLAVFRGEDGRAHVIDAYCPHIGANMAVGGRVKGNCLECPFHGWQFNGDDGKCTHIPTTAKIPDVAKVKSYDVAELNGFIYMWYHAEGTTPQWTIPEIEEIQNGEWAYRGRTEHHVNSHIEDIPENGSDLAHLPQVHSPLMTAGIDLRFMWSKLWEFGKHQWAGTWTQSEAPNGHVGSLNLKHSLVLFGMQLPFLDMDVCAKQIGPGIVYLSFESPVGRGAYLHHVTPMEPLLQRMVHHIYFQWWVPPIVPKFFLIAEALMVERDLMIWNNKRYNMKPVFVKSHEDQTISKHRRWYSQFYSKNSPKLAFQKESMDW